MQIAVGTALLYQPFVWAALLPLSFDAHIGAVGACLDLKDVHAVAHCRAGSVSELSSQYGLGSCFAFGCATGLA
eukprot:CAMPEP_0181216782 /NCGR_PEP_ID=MMETSP1096-20121128/26781_1 /TAXON_ID=156174 ORGANISM="Chrysochromulina ericina, Strain CCMP281" /NCGR_SAMPLE_ID=MMETSP1096 /ASSEMBLY_ACC=CAM_ASM_000453 /LENGTH=73 /DNA_ID=CAMNT_0023308829 /DNA_START=250 /DNA_END=471 /DNA_ORIENTATION=-